MSGLSGGKASWFVLPLFLLIIIMLATIIFVNLFGILYNYRAFQIVREYQISTFALIETILGHLGSMLVISAVPIVGGLVTLSSPILLIVGGIKLRNLMKILQKEE
jgi:hypothetical protein